MLLINCEIELELPCLKYCVIFKISRTTKVGGANPADTTLITGAIFQLNNAQLYVPVFTLSVNDKIKFFENIKQGFKKTISWNKWRSEITTQTKNNNLDYLIDPTFWNINRMYVISFKNGDDIPTRNSFVEYYTPLV